MERTAAVLILCFNLFGIISSEDSWPLYRVATVLHEPWVMKNGTGYRGFIVDLLDELSPQLRFHYKLQLTSPGQHGNMDYIHGQYDSIVSDVQKKMADIGAADVMVTEDRLKRVSFSRPFIFTGAQMLIRKPLVRDRRTFTTPFSPFSWSVWMLVVVSVVLVMLLVYASERLVQPSGENDTKRTSFYKSLRILFCPLCIWGHRKPSLSISGHILVPFWWIFVLLTIITYLANLTSLYVQTGSGKPVIPFKTFTQLAAQSDVTYGGWFGMPLNRNDFTQLTMDRFISSHFSYYTNIEDDIARVRNTDRPFAAILSGTEGEYLSNKHCDLMLLREQLFPIEYAIVCPYGAKGGRLCGDITMSLHKLTDSGVLQELIQKWWTSAGTGCVVTREEEFITGSDLDGRDRFKPVDPMELGLAFSILLCGLIVSGLVLVLEGYRKRKRKSVDRKSSIKDTNNKANEQPMLAIDVDAMDGDTVRHSSDKDDTL